MNRSNNENQFIAIKVEDNLFAVSADHVLYIAKGNESMSQAVITKKTQKIKCIIDIGGQLVTIVNLPGIGGDIPVLNNVIVVLEHAGQNIGILANEVQLVTISANEMCMDSVTKTKSFIHAGKTYLVLDINELY